ncbi:MAG: glycosyltransferase family A protein, partial [Pseudomonadota bacterium]
MAARRNEAIEMAAGEYVAQMDADAVCAPDRLAVQLLSLRAGYDICGSWATRGAHPLRPDGTVSFPVGSKALMRHCLIGDPLPTSTVMIAGDYIRASGFRYNEAWGDAAAYHAHARHILLGGARAWSTPRALIARRAIDVRPEARTAEAEDAVRAMLLREIGVTDGEVIAAHNRCVAGKSPPEERARMSNVYRRALPDLKPEVFGPNDFGIVEGKLSSVPPLAPEPAAAPGRPDVSVIVPALNLEAYLERCVASILDGAEAAIEIIIVDDGSTDGTKAVAERLRSERGGAVRVVSQTHAGPAVARNAGLDAAEGRYVFFVDGDDELTPGALDLFLRKARE